MISFFIKLRIKKIDIPILFMQLYILFIYTRVLDMFKRRAVVKESSRADNSVREERRKKMLKLIIY